jgi:sodium/bile acid cotransporter 7
MPLAVRRFAPDPFILTLFAAILVASLLPARGEAAQIVDAATTAAIILLFFLHGVRLERSAVIAALTHWPLHLVILATTFVLFPLLGLALHALLGPLLPAPLWLGLLFLCALPSTVQSSIAFTSIARGNVAGAVAAAATSNILGVALAPVIVGLITSAHGVISPGGIVKIASELVAPFAIGHLLRPWLGDWAARNRRLLVFTDRGTIVLAVYSAFSAAVIGGIWRQIPPVTLVVLILICTLLLALVLAATRYGARALGFSREDEIAILFCGSKKSLASGLPMARVLFSGPAIGGVMLPLILFHQIQLIVCAWIARRYARQPRSES